MDVVIIPLLRPQAEVASALELLRRWERAGVVVNPDWASSYRLLHAGDMLRARDAGIPVLAEVPGGYSVLTVDQPMADAFHLDLVRPALTWQQYETMLDEQGAQFALVGEAYDAAMVVTRHEEQQMTLSGTGGFQCSGSPRHYFPEPRVALGDPCPEIPLCTSPAGEPVIEPA
jgi:hypothetical protein